MKLDLRMLYLKSWKCSLNLIWNELLSGRYISYIWAYEAIYTAPFILLLGFLVA